MASQGKENTRPLEVREEKESWVVFLVSLSMPIFLIFLCSWTHHQTISR